MTTSAFEKNLFNKVNSTGGVFRKADFHIHMPGSSDYEYKGIDDMEMLSKTITDLTSSSRADGYLVLSVPSSWVNDTVHVYLSFKIPVPNKSSESTFLGTVSIQP